MEPKLPSPNRGSEKLPAAYSQSIEHTVSVPTPERLPDFKRERVESGAGDTPAAPIQPVLPPPIHTSTPMAAQPVDDSAQTGTPVVAADEDLIEKEWVDKAKAIIAQTKDDPYRREKEVSKLQADYLRKRYGKELGAS